MVRHWIRGQDHQGGERGGGGERRDGGWCGRYRVFIARKLTDSSAEIHQYKHSELCMYKPRSYSSRVSNFNKAHEVYAIMSSTAKWSLSSSTITYNVLEFSYDTVLS